MKMKMQKALLNVLMVEANRQMQKLNRKAVRAAPEFRVDSYNWMADPELGLLSADAERTTLYLIRFDKHGASAEVDVTTVTGAASGSTVVPSTTALVKHTSLSKCVKAIWEHAQHPLVGNKALTGDDADALVSVGASSLPTGRSAPTGRKRVVDSMCEELNAALAALGTAHTKDFCFEVSSDGCMVAELYGKQYTVRRSRTVCVSDIGDAESVQVLNTGGHRLPALSHIARKILEHVESTRLAHESAPSAPATTATTPAATYPRALVGLGVALNAELSNLALRSHRSKITFNLESFAADHPTGKCLVAYANRQYYFVYGNQKVCLSRSAIPHPEDSQLPTGGTSPSQIANAIWKHVRKQCVLWTEGREAVRRELSATLRQRVSVSEMDIADDGTLTFTAGPYGDKFNVDTDRRLTTTVQKNGVEQNVVLARKGSDTATLAQRVFNWLEAGPHEKDSEVAPAARQADVVPPAAQRQNLRDVCSEVNAELEKLGMSDRMYHNSYLGYVDCVVGGVIYRIDAQRAMYVETNTGDRSALPQGHNGKTASVPPVGEWFTIAQEGSTAAELAQTFQEVSAKHREPAQPAACEAEPSLLDSVNAALAQMNTAPDCIPVEMHLLSSGDMVFANAGRTYILCVNESAAHVHVHQANVENVRSVPQPTLIAMAHFDHQTANPATSTQKAVWLASVIWNHVQCEAKNKREV